MPLWLRKAISENRTQGEERGRGEAAADSTGEAPPAAPGEVKVLTDSLG